MTLLLFAVDVVAAVAVAVAVAVVAAATFVVVAGVATLQKRSKNDLM